MEKIEAVWLVDFSNIILAQKIIMQQLKISLLPGPSI